MRVFSRLKRLRGWTVQAVRGEAARVAGVANRHKVLRRRRADLLHKFLEILKKWPRKFEHADTWRICYR
jgi:hypothetical protein